MACAVQSHNGKATNEGERRDPIFTIDGVLPADHVVDVFLQGGDSITQSVLCKLIADTRFCLFWHKWLEDCFVRGATAPLGARNQISLLITDLQVTAFKPRNRPASRCA